MAIGTALVNGMVLPMLPVFGVAPVAIDWVGVSTFLGVLLGPIGVARTIEKLNGVTS